MNNNQPFFRFKAAAGDEPTNAELLIFAAIGDWEELGEVSAKQFATELSKLPSSVKRLDIHINSPGGSVFEAQAIYSRLADHRSEKIVYVDGLAASAASIVAMVGHKIYIRANANMMIHLPSGFAIGNADDMRTVASALDSVTESMINVYAKRSGLEREELRSLMAAETWFSPQQAVEKGFADEMRGVVKAAALVAEKRVIINGVEHDLSRFHNIPAFTATTKTNPMPNKPKAAAIEEENDENGNGDEGREQRERERREREKEKPTPPTPPQQPPPPNTVPGQQAATAVTDYDKGVKAERDRISALQALDKPATHEIVTAAIRDGKTVNDIAAECIEAMSKTGTQQARRMDARQVDGIPGSDAGNGDSHNDEFAKTLKAKVKQRAKGLRPSFSRN